MDTILTVATPGQDISFSLQFFLTSKHCSLNFWTVKYRKICSYKWNLFENRISVYWFFVFKIKFFYESISIVYRDYERSTDLDLKQCKLFRICFQLIFHEDNEIITLSNLIKYKWNTNLANKKEKIVGNYFGNCFFTYS